MDLLEVMEDLVCECQDRHLAGCRPHLEVLVVGDLAQGIIMEDLMEDHLEDIMVDRMEDHIMVHLMVGDLEVHHHQAGDPHRRQDIMEDNLEVIMVVITKNVIRNLCM